MRTRLAGIVLALAVVFPVRAQLDDDERPARGVARLSVLNGDVSMRRGDTGDWTAASINAPVVVGDHVVTGANSRAEVQFDYASMMRLSSDSDIRMAELENRRYIIQLARGLTTFRVLRDIDADIEISTPNVAVRPMKKGIYRIHVRPDGTTEVTVRSGEAEISTPRGVETLRSGRTMLVRGTASEPEFQYISRIAEDAWDDWNEQRDRNLERSGSYRYVSRDIYGAEDLDGYGSWVHVAPYGNVWRPRVSVGWAPYRLGRWSWVDWYGWSWVSYDPWGWAPYHYGRWFYQGNSWCWWPGGIGSRHYWRPALVSFFGWPGAGFGIGVGGGFGRVGWVPLAPHETYRPWYGNRYYRGNGNGINVVNNVNITNIYRNARVNNGVTVVDGGDFSRGRVTNLRSVSGNELRRASHVQGQMPVVPGRESLRVSDRDVSPRRADSAAGDGRFYSRNPVRNVERVPFEEQRRGIEQVSRRTFGEPGEATRTAAAPVRSAERGSERAAGQDSSRTPAADNARGAGSEGGWRRVGETPARAAESAPARSTETDRSGWRRFGEPAARTADNAAAPARSVESAPARSAETDRSGWRRFGEPAARAAEGTAPARSAESAPARSAESDGGGWRRFGDAGRNSAGSADQTNSGGRVDANRSGSPRVERGREDSSPRRNEAPRSESVSPRSDAPRSERRSSGDTPARVGSSSPFRSESAPARSTDNSPRFSGGGRSVDSPRSSGVGRTSDGGSRVSGGGGGNSRVGPGGGGRVSGGGGSSRTSGGGSSRTSGGGGRNR